jgi:hypothetical protein
MVNNKKYWKTIGLEIKSDELNEYNPVWPNAR